MEFLHCLHVTGVGNDDGKVAELFEQILGHETSWKVGKSGFGDAAY
jgi:hypothetical protein